MRSSRRLFALRLALFGLGQFVVFITIASHSNRREETRKPNNGGLPWRTAPLAGLHYQRNLSVSSEKYAIDQFNWTTVSYA